MLRILIVQRYLRTVRHAIHGLVREIGFAGGVRRAFALLLCNDILTISYTTRICW